MLFKNYFALRAQTLKDDYRLRWWITLAVMLVAVAEVLDLTIVTVSLPDMMGSLGANVDQIAWVMTSFSVATAIMMPLTGLLVARLGTRRLLLIVISGFMLSSILCGLAINLSMMIFCRVLQGLFGASLMPLSQLILRRVFPKKEYVKGATVWGVGIICAPVFGPVLGGYITHYLNWRWVFYINVPICFFSFSMVLLLIRETALELKKIDWPSLCLMVSGIAALQILLDRGNSVAWFDSASSYWLAAIALMALVGFCWRSWGIPDAIIHLRIFKDRNFSLAVLLMFLFCALIFGQLAQTPLMLQTLYDYPAQTAGLLMAPRGLGAIAGMLLVGRLFQSIDARVTLYVGLFFAVLGSFMLSGFNPNFNKAYFIWASSLQGVGMGIFMLPLTILSLSTLAAKDLAEGSGLFSFSRSLGLSIGISVNA